MRRRSNEVIFCIGLLSLVMMAPGLVGAVDYPTKGRAINIIVPFAPSGGNDVAARIQAPVLEKELGVPVVVSGEGEARAERA